MPGEPDVTIIAGAGGVEIPANAVRCMCFGVVPEERYLNRP